MSGVSQTGDIKEDRKVFSFALDGFSFNAIVVGTAIPWKDLEGPCHTCRTWPEAIDEVRQHTAHAIVTVDHETAGYKELAWYLTKGIEALLPALDSIGVYWGAGTTISSSKAFHALSVAKAHWTSFPFTFGSTSDPILRMNQGSRSSPQE